MAKNGLDKWFKQKWVDIGSKRKDGGRIGYKRGGIAKGCGKVMSNRRKVTKVY